MDGLGDLRLTFIALKPSVNSTEEIAALTTAFDDISGSCLSPRLVKSAIRSVSSYVRDHCCVCKSTSRVHRLQMGPPNIPVLAIFISREEFQI